MTQKDIESSVDKVQSAKISDEHGPGNERWEMRPLSELIEPVLGKTPKRSEDKYWGGDIQWASAKDISQSKTRHIYDTAENMTEAGKEVSNAKTLPAGTVVVVARGSVGEISQLGKPMTFNQSCYALDTNDQILDDYLYYAWQYVFGQVKAVSYGTVFDTITMKSFEDIEIPVPPLEEQKDIADLLGTLDDCIENNLDLINSLKNVCRVGFRYWFLNYDNQDNLVEINASNPEVENIPESFTMSKFGDVTENYDSKRIPLAQKKRNQMEDKYPYYGAVGQLGSVDDYVYDGKYLLIAEDGTNSFPNGVAVTNLIDERFWASNHVHVVRGKGDVSSEYLRWCMENTSVKPYLTGSVQPKLNQKNLNSIEIPIPPASEIQKFTNFVQPIHELIWLKEQENQNLDELIKVLLPNTLSGKIAI